MIILNKLAHIKNIKKYAWIKKKKIATIYMIQGR